MAEKIQKVENMEPTFAKGKTEVCSSHCEFAETCCDCHLQSHFLQAELGRVSDIIQLGIICQAREDNGATPREIAKGGVRYSMTPRVLRSGSSVSLLVSHRRKPTHPRAFAEAINYRFTTDPCLTNVFVLLKIYYRVQQSIGGRRDMRLILTTCTATRQITAINDSHYLQLHGASKFDNIMETTPRSIKNER